MNIDLSGKTALVTGSTGGIGFAVARGLAACGARVAVNGRKQETADAALAKIRAALPAAKLLGVAADVSTAEGCDKLAAAVPEADILVMPASSSPRISSPFPTRIGAASSRSMSSPACVCRAL